MAPEGFLPKRKPTENQYLFDLGKRGRKTGLTVPEGERDEHGLERQDHLFSSPEKTKKTNGHGINGNATISSEEDMEFGESTIPELTAAIAEQKQRAMRLPPKSKSPIKTFLQSPARRNPSMGPASSPTRGSPRAASVASSVRRKLDFTNDSFDGNVLESPVTNGSPKKRGRPSTKALSAKLTNGTRLAPHKNSYTPDRDDEDQDDTAQTGDDEGLENGEDSFQMINGADEVDAQTEEPEPEHTLEPSTKVKGRAKAKEPEMTEVSAKKRGRKPRSYIPPVIEEAEEEAEEPPAKRTRRSLDGATSAPQPITKAKSGRLSKTVASKPAVVAKEPEKGPNIKAAPKAAPKRPKLAPIAEDESPQAQRGPPMPRNNRGLLILRRETPMEGASFKQTRSGRNSIKPLAYWKNESVVYGDEVEDINGTKFFGTKIKEIVRVDEIAEQRSKRSYYRPSKSKKRPSAEGSDDDELEPWEEEPGQIVGQVRTWDPQDPTGLQVPETETEIAYSSSAIRTRDVPGATFKFAKTLTLPFFGSGMVDLPVGAEKKEKNSRRMQMVFFVFTGRVEVLVNENNFSIGKGGMWQVPRGNTYSIVNNYDKPARIFFSQGCEIEEEAPESQ